MISPAHYCISCTVAAWPRLHPEVHSGNSLNHSAAHLGLSADSYPYAAYPTGVPNGTDYFVFLGKQWTSLSALLGADVLVLRDGLGTYTNYGRRVRRRAVRPPDATPLSHLQGPYGATASDALASNDVWRSAFRAMYAGIKTAAPDTLLLGYSSAASAVGESRMGCMDLESVVSYGWIDGWIDQSWSGAWEDYYPSKHQLGWTWQRAYIGAHRAQIEGGNLIRARIAVAHGRVPAPARHYVLHETFDAYEQWTTIGSVPGKLTWGNWAFQAPAFTRGNGSLASADGSYLSWSWSWSSGWVSPANVTFMASTIDAASAAARGATRSHRPVQCGSSGGSQ